MAVGREVGARKRVLSEKQLKSLRTYIVKKKKKDIESMCVKIKECRLSITIVISISLFFRRVSDTKMSPLLYISQVYRGCIITTICYI